MLHTNNLTRDVLTQVHKLGKIYGTNQTGNGKKLVIEYSSPNIAKSFHVGHLRSTIIGAFLANLYRTCGWEVVGLNYLGDWGTQVRTRSQGAAANSSVYSSVLSQSDSKNTETKNFSNKIQSNISLTSMSKSTKTLNRIHKLKSMQQLGSVVWKIMNQKHYQIGVYGGN